MSKESKKSFVLYYDYRDHLALLKDEERGRLLMALLDYGEYGKEPELEGAALMAFSFIRAQIDRDTAKYEEICRKRREAGKQGGRPAKPNESNEKQTEAKKANGFSEKQTKAKKPDNDTDNETDNETDTDNDTGTDTDIYIPPSGGDPPPPAPEPAPDRTPYKEIVDMYHEICKDYPKLRSVNKNRKDAIAARWKEYDHNLEIFRELFEKANASLFLKGKNKRNWAADFNWLMNSANMAKVLEGNYDNEKQEGGQNRGEFSGNSEQQTHGAKPASETSLSGFHMAI